MHSDTHLELAVGHIPGSESPGTGLRVTLSWRSGDGKARHRLWTGRHSVGFMQPASWMRSVSTVRRGAGEKTDRTLIYIPIIHIQSDTLARSVQRVTIQRLGRRGWKRSSKQVWAETFRTVEG